MKLLVSITTYPRDGKSTYKILERTANSLFQEINKEIDIKIIVVGDDYPNLEELKPIFNDYPVFFFNINENNALRNKDIDKETKWKQAIQRSKIFILETALKTDCDYILMSSDDDLYCNQKITKSIEYIEKNNYPDFVFCLGTYARNLVLPAKYTPYPEPRNLISSGCLYKLSNKKFINTIIHFRKTRWMNVLKYIDFYSKYKKNPNENIHYLNILKNNIKPEDLEQWTFLLPYFRKGIFRSYLINEVQVHHDTEQTLFNYI